ncbi:Crp/Fnr family transcriptional regulator [Variovorax terrae]|uniref:Crp/Fnr family transcriptional regulator n=1 Tax=Variovorax terrae TaxID=2923278 RepID=A0A9X1VVN7_9BURK|nr:Crp/Fnr family transcriptional regulator [Variovorax terrae]MCJ0764232.1 Crp/Fnr family transcriptional regulator [Variovorax terrae]
MSQFASWDASSALAAGWAAAAGPGAAMRAGAGALIYAQGDVDPRFYLIRSGFVQASIERPDGQPLLLEIFGPGTLFGEGAAFDGLRRYVTTTAVTECELGVYEAPAIQRRMAAEPALALELIRIMSAKQRTLAQKLAGVTAALPADRVCELLRRIARMPGRGAGGCHVDLTHEEIGAMTGLSRVTVTRVLRQLAAQGLVVTGLRRIDIPPGSALLGIARY